MRKFIRKTLSLVLAAVMLLSGAVANANAIGEVYGALGECSYYKKLTWNGSTFGSYKVTVSDGTHKAFCANEHKDAVPKGTKITDIDVSTNSKLRKVLWYGYLGPGSVVDDWSSSKAILFTSHAASYARGNSTGPSVREWAEKIFDKAAPPEGFKVYVCTMNGSSYQPLVYWDYAEKGRIELKKSSANPSVTNGNSCYALEDAVYKIYDSKGKVVDTLTLDEDGYDKSKALDVGEYTIKEVTAPKGYAVDTKTHNVTVKEGKTTTLKVTDEPLNDPAAIELVKINQETGELGADSYKSLAGAQFTIKYYDGYYTKDNLPSKATRSWVIATKELKDNSGKGRYFAYLNKNYLVSGDEFYKDDEGEVILPLGTISIEETKAADGYTLDGGILTVKSSGEKIVGPYVTQIKAEGSAVQLLGGNQFTVSNRPTRGDFELKKMDADLNEPMANIPFEIVSKTTGEKHTVYTDENGYYSSASSYIKHTDEKGLWFELSKDKTTKVDDSLGALPYGEYTITELRCDANVFKELYSGSFTISKNGVVVDLGTINNKDAKYPELGTTATEDAGNSHYAGAVGDITVTDTISYKNLKEGKTYKAVGTIMVKSTGEALLDKDGNAVTVSKEFTVEAEDGSTAEMPRFLDGKVSLSFTFDVSGLAGEDIVVFEELYLDGRLVGEHKDINDEGQTIHFPEIGTSAIDKDTQSNITNADKEIVIIDTVSYNNLEAGKTYTVTGTLMDKETGEEVKDAEGNVVTASTEFTAEESSGTVDVTFTFDGSHLAGKTLVAFETVKHEDRVLGVHADINDDAQTVHVPEIGTTALDEETQTQNAVPDAEVTIIDTVAYKNLVPGKEYKATGYLVLKETGEALLDSEGNKITGETTFTPEAAEGTVDVTFTFDASALTGKEVVVFEKVLLGECVIAEHEDPEDEGQTIYFPEIHTSAKDSESESNSALADEEVTIIDTVSYKNLIPGKEYKVTGVLMNKETEEALLDAEGNPITGETIFTPEAAEGTVDVVFTFDGSLLAGKTIVVFEKLFMEEVQLGFHEDITDEEQSIHFPLIKTTATDGADGDKKVMANRKTVIVDKVEYTNLVPGTEYRMVGTLMDKATGKPVVVKGKEVTAETTFVPEAADGFVELKFEFNANGLGEKDLVVFEKIFVGEGEVANHEDINDIGQTVEMVTPPVKTGDTLMMFGLIGLGIALVGGGAVLLFKRRRNA